MESIIGKLLGTLAALLGLVFGVYLINEGHGKAAAGFMLASLVILMLVISKKDD